MSRQHRPHKQRITDAKMARLLIATEIKAGRIKGARIKQHEETRARELGFSSYGALLDAGLDRRYNENAPRQGDTSGR